MNKVCTVCNKTLPESEFHFRNKAKGTRMNQCKKCGIIRAKENYAKNGGWEYAKTKRVRHGMSHQEFIKRCELQDWKCLICQETVTQLVVDHDHSCCDKMYSCGDCVRGLICTHCNRGLGAFRDNTRYLDAAKAYLLGV